MEWLDNGSVVNLDATGSPISLKSVLDNSSNYNSSFSSNALDNCSDSCGWVAAMIALVAYGSYAVPIKQTQSIEVHPLVFQSYKSLMMLLLAPPVTMFLGLAPIFQQPITLYWGILSGGLWVLGGTMGVLAVRLAGMSRAVAVWASVIVMVNFVWGILIFHEPVASTSHTAAAFVLLGLGSIGMSWFVAHPVCDDDDVDVDNINLHLIASEQEYVSNSNDMLFLNVENSVFESRQLQETLLQHDHLQERHTHAKLRRSQINQSNDMDEDNHIDDTDANSYNSLPAFNTETHVRIFKYMVLSKPTAGIIAAVFNGLLGGSSLIPLHYAKEQGYGGARYIMSYAIGAFLANLIVWFVYYVVLVVRRRSLESSWESTLLHAATEMPDPKFQQLWKPGFCAGFLLASGMFSSIISVTYLGQGVGNSVVQAKIIVSGIWGIFYFKEIDNKSAIQKWFLSAFVSLFGIIWLSYERIAAKTASHNHESILFFA